MAHAKGIGGGGGTTNNGGSKKGIGGISKGIKKFSSSNKTGSINIKSSNNATKAKAVYNAPKQQKQTVSITTSGYNGTTTVNSSEQIDLSKFLNDSVNNIKNVKNDLKTTLDKLKKNPVEELKKATNATVGAVSSAWNTFTSAANEFLKDPAGVTGAVLVSTFGGVVNLLEGFADGVVTLGSDVKISAPEGADEKTIQNVENYKNELRNDAKEFVQQDIAGSLTDSLAQEIGVYDKDYFQTVKQGGMGATDLLGKVMLVGATGGAAIPAVAFIDAGNTAEAEWANGASYDDGATAAVISYAYSHAGWASGSAIQTGVDSLGGRILLDTLTGAVDGTQEPVTATMQSINNGDNRSFYEILGEKSKEKNMVGQMIQTAGFSGLMSVFGERSGLAEKYREKKGVTSSNASSDVNLKGNSIDNINDSLKKSNVKVDESSRTNRLKPTKNEEMGVSKADSFDRIKQIDLGELPSSSRKSLNNLPGFDDVPNSNRGSLKNIEEMNFDDVPTSSLSSGNEPSVVSSKTRENYVEDINKYYEMGKNLPLNQSLEYRANKLVEAFTEFDHNPSLTREEKVYELAKMFDEHGDEYPSRLNQELARIENRKKALETSRTSQVSDGNRAKVNSSELTSNTQSSGNPFDRIKQLDLGETSSLSNKKVNKLPEASDYLTTNSKRNSLQNIEEMNFDDVPVSSSANKSGDIYNMPRDPFEKIKAIDLDEVQTSSESLSAMNGSVETFDNGLVKVETSKSPKKVEIDSETGRLKRGHGFLTPEEEKSYIIDYFKDDESIVKHRQEMKFMDGRKAEIMEKADSPFRYSSDPYYELAICEKDIDNHVNVLEKRGYDIDEVDDLLNSLNRGENGRVNFDVIASSLREKGYDADFEIIDAIDGYDYSVVKSKKIKNSLDSYNKLAKRLDGIDMEGLDQVYREVLDKDMPKFEFEYSKTKTMNNLLVGTLKNGEEIHGTGKVENGNDLLVDSLSKINPENESGMAFMRKIYSLSQDGNELQILRSSDVNTSYYRPSENYVMIEYGSDKGVRVVFHEYGHALHYNVLGGRIPDNFEEIVQVAREKSTQNGLPHKLLRETFSAKFKNYLEYKKVKRETLNELVLEFEEAGCDRSKAKKMAKLKFDDESLKNYYINNKDEDILRAVSDMIDAVYQGEKMDLNGKKINLFGQHGYNYYHGNVQAQFNELIANFSSLKVLNDFEGLDYVRRMFGDEFYQMMDDTFNKLIKFGGRIYGSS